METAQKCNTNSPVDRPPPPHLSTRGTRPADSGKDIESASGSNTKLPLLFLGLSVIFRLFSNTLTGAVKKLNLKGVL